MTQVTDFRNVAVRPNGNGYHAAAGVGESHNPFEDVAPDFPDFMPTDPLTGATFTELLDTLPAQITASVGQDDTEFLLTESADDEGNAQCVKRLYGEQFCYVDAYGWMRNTGRFWESDNAEAHLERAIVETLKQRREAAVRADREAIVKATKPSSANVRNTKYLYRSLNVASVSEFDSNPDLLNCANGIVNLRTGELMPHTSAHKFTYCLPVAYDPAATSREWEQFLQSAIRDDAVISYLQMAAGYSITGRTSEECVHYVHGPTRSGKGTFTETILSLIGRPLGHSADFGTFTANRDVDAQNFALAPLKPARFVVSSESNRNESLNEAKIKMLTGGDYIRCAFKHRDHFEYRPQFKIWLVSNHPVNGDVDDEAFWGRLRVIEFPNSYLGKEDKTLKHRLKSAKSLQGVLSWLVAGARRWYESPVGLQTPGSVKQTTQRQREERDYVAQWLNECTKADGEAWTVNHLLYQSYENWCNDNGVTPKKLGNLSKALTSKGYTASVAKRTGAGVQRGVSGLSLLE
ncbi:hypothetical protein GC175_04965 [bacterium]|nr:hypothetical protein [bacterium]